MTPENLEPGAFNLEKYGFREPPDSGKSGVLIYKEPPLESKSRVTQWADSTGNPRVEVKGVCSLAGRGGIFAGLVSELERLERKRDTAKRYGNPFPADRLQQLYRQVGPDRRPCGCADLCWHGPLRWEITVYASAGHVFAVAADYDAALLEARRLAALHGFEEDEWPT